MSSPLLKLLVSAPALLALYVLAAPASARDAEAPPAPEPYCAWKADNYEIAEPLCGLNGDLERGRAIASDGSRGNCVACHRLPTDATSVFGTIGPDLAGVASRFTGPQLRMRVVDTHRINPLSIMPGFYRDPSLINRPARMYRGHTFLTAQQVEDVIAFLKTLK